MNMGRNRIYLKNKKRLSKYKIFILTIILSLILTFCFEKKIKKYVYNYSKAQLEKNFNMAITDLNYKSYGAENYLEYKYNDNGEIIELKISEEQANKTLNNMLVSLKTNLKNIEKKQYKYIKKELKYTKIATDNISLIISVPTGTFTNNILFNYAAPKIPVRVDILESNVGKIKTKVKDYGINSILLEVYVDIEIKGEIIILNQIEEVKVKASVLVDSHLIQGIVPNFYSNYHNV